jgi:hypothetical protein
MITDLGPEASCMMCHQGRQSTNQVAEALADLPVDEVDEDLSFINVHYAIAAATLMGGETHGGYEYPGRQYVERFQHVPELQTCVECHDPHSQAVEPDTCSPCHVSVVGFDDLKEIRTDPVDYDGDGNTAEGIRFEIAALEQRLYQALQDHASTVAGTPIAYTDRSPYFFTDLNGDGEASSDETGRDNEYVSWTPKLLKAAYNYHFVQEDRGSYAHNADYVLQLLYDSLEDLSGGFSPGTEGFLRPTSQEAKGSSE